MAKTAKRLFICLDNAGYEASLKRLKIYVALPDAKARRTGYLRLVDESGEDYLYPSQRFVVAELPVSSRRAVLLRHRSIWVPLNYARHHCRRLCSSSSLRFKDSNFCPASPSLPAAVSC